MPNPLLVIHLAGAAVTAVVSIGALLLKKSPVPLTQPSTRWLLALTIVQTFTGSLLSLQTQANPFKYCANLSFYFLGVGFVLLYINGGNFRFLKSMLAVLSLNSVIIIGTIYLLLTPYKLPPALFG